MDRALILAHLSAEQLRCPGCGMYLDESTGTDFNHAVHEQKCAGCAAKEAHRETAEKTKRDFPKGTFLTVSKIPRTTTE